MNITKTDYSVAFRGTSREIEGLIMMLRILGLHDKNVFLVPPPYRALLAEINRKLANE